MLLQWSQIGHLTDPTAAIDEMKIRIQQLVSDSLRDQLYGKAIECLQALRDGCVQVRDVGMQMGVLTLC